MSKTIQHFIYKNYWWLTLVAVVIGGLLIICFSKSDNVPTHFVTLCASAIGIAFLVQKQMLDEIQLFERLFTQFNKRYDDLHKDLARIVTGQIRDVDCDREILDKYFNLCAEEYLFFKERRIHPDTWRSWCLGMKIVLECDIARQYWLREEKQGSHYGLTKEIIYEGAGMPEALSRFVG